MSLADTAKRAFVVAVVVVGVVVLALALWKLRLLIALLFLAFIVAAAMRPGVEALRRCRIPRGVGIAAPLPRPRGARRPAALGSSSRARSTRSRRRRRAADVGSAQRGGRETTGVKHDLLVGLAGPAGGAPVGRGARRPGARDHADGVRGLHRHLLRPRRGRLLDLRARARRRPRHLAPPAPAPQGRARHLDLIDLKLGAYVRGQALLIVLVATVLSLIFWAIGLPFWLLIGVFAGVVEIVPVIGPLAAGALAVGVGLTESWQLGARGRDRGARRPAARGLPRDPARARRRGRPLAAARAHLRHRRRRCSSASSRSCWRSRSPPCSATLVDVIVLDKDPAEEDVPAVIFAAKDAETRLGLARGL